MVLIDTARRLEELHRVYPGLAKRFECIGTSDSIKAKKAAAPVPSESGKGSLAKAPEVVEKKVQPAPKPVAAPKEAPAPKTAATKAAAPAKKRPVQAPAVKEPARMAEHSEQEMDIDEFAKYACQYASKIDCSISGKSMLALYERIEIMEEDGIALTREEAENLIEEAADRAENPSFFKRLTGIFSSKYDKDGLLILKEEHFL